MLKYISSEFSSKGKGENSDQSLVTQLRSARGELRRMLVDLADEDAQRRLKPMNCISWMIGHLANQENRYWVLAAQGKTLFPELPDLVGFGKPASTLPLNEMWAVWRTVTAAADVYLDTVTPEILPTHIEWQGKPHPESVGTLLQRALYHYWYHIGEAMRCIKCWGTPIWQSSSVR